MLARIAPYVAFVSATILKRAAARMDRREHAWIGYKLTRDRFSPEVKSFAQFCNLTVHAWKNRNFELDVNGELELLGKLGAFNLQTVLDVGANAGDWASAAWRLLPGATIHAFEISPDTSALLRTNIERIVSDGRVIVNDIGLSDRAATVPIYQLPSDSTTTSTQAFILDAQTRGEPIVLEAQVIRGDDYLRTHSIEHVDLLKVDVEGAEKSVLDGFSGALDRDAISMIQLEYGWPNAYAGFLLKDMHAMFRTRGYVFGKIYPEGVAFKTYELDDEDFLGPNYLACRAEREDIIAALRCPVP